MAASVIFAEYVVANNVSFGGYAAWVQSYAPLLEDPPVVGENVHIPGHAGREPYGKDADELHVVLTVFVDGDYNFDDDSISDNPRQQFLANRATLRTALGPTPLGLDDGTVELDWYQPDDETVITVPVQSLGFTNWTYITPTFAQTSWDLIVPASIFEELGS